MKIGDLVYINSDRLKTKARDRYLIVAVDRTTCKVQKFTGTQLRARIYTVNRADVLTIPPWKFPNEEFSNETSDEDDCQFSVPKRYNHTEEVIQQEEMVHDESGEIASDQGEDDVFQEEDVEPVQVETVIRRRSERKKKMPGYLDQYICDA